jgi:hypothetical protein
MGKGDKYIKLKSFFLNLSRVQHPPIPLSEMTEFTDEVNIPMKIQECYDIVRNEEQGYKTYKGYRYHLNFPDAWILDELQNTGRECWNCVGHPGGLEQGFAMWRGIILGYCANCAYDYNGERGCGFMGCGIENVGYGDNYVGPSAFETYLETVNLDNIGDVSEYPEDTMENHFGLQNNNVEVVESDAETIPYSNGEPFDEIVDYCAYCGEGVTQSDGNICKECYYGDKNDAAEQGIDIESDEEDDNYAMEDETGEYTALIHGEYVELENGDIRKPSELRFGDKVKLTK